MRWAVLMLYGVRLLILAAVVAGIVRRVAQQAVRLARRLVQRWQNRTHPAP